MYEVKEIQLTSEFFSDDSLNLLRVCFISKYPIISKFRFLFEGKGSPDLDGP